MTINQVRKWYHSHLEEVDILLAHALRRPKEFLFMHPKYNLRFIEQLRLRYYLHLHRRGYSVAAITRHKQFYGLDFYVNKDVLIPRPETELMVEEAAKNIRQKTLLIDVGTGSGCIPIAIYKAAPEAFRNDITIIASDISRRALRVARSNARTHEVPISFVHGNLLEPLAHHLKFSTSDFDYVIITANLPYLTEEQFEREPSIRKEPKLALVAKDNGLALYEELLQHIKKLPTFKQLSLFLEIDPQQHEAILQLIKKYFPTATAEIKTDLAGQDRLVCIRL